MLNTGCGAERNNGIGQAIAARLKFTDAAFHLAKLAFEAALEEQIADHLVSTRFQSQAS